MSLLVWLPLIGDLKNRGVSSCSFKDNGVTLTETGGKINNKCYYLNGKTLSKPNFSELVDVPNFSVCCWVKFTSFPSAGNNAYCICLNTTSASSYKICLGVYSASGSDGTKAHVRLNGNDSTGDIYLNQWYHLAATVSGTVGNIYINGKQMKTVTVSPTNGATNLIIGGRSTNAGGTAFTGVGAPGYYNDVRVYNHCLSPKEVRMISQGLILDYPLSNPNLATEKTVPDCSGYKNNGTVIGTLSMDTNSARNQNCVKFNGSAAIACGKGAKVTDAITVNMWAYMDNWSTFSSMRIASCTESGGWNFENVGHFICYAGGAYRRASGTFKDLSAGWHMITGTFDGYQVKVYADGELKASSTALATKTPITYNASNGIFLGAEAAGSATTPTTPYFNGKISDFKIFCTALPIEDIVNLYEARMSFLDNGTVYAHEFIEDNSGYLKFAADGIIKSGNFSEINHMRNMKTKVLPDGSAWARIYWLDLKTTKTVFANNDEANFCNASNRLSYMGLVDHFKNKDGVYEFMLTYPSLSTSLYNRWSQTNSPNDTAATGLTKITTAWTKHSGAIITITSSHKSSAVYAMNEAGNWWAPIGQKVVYNSTGIPGATGNTETETELWVRIDNLQLLEKTSMLQDKYLQALSINEF